MRRHPQVSHDDVFAIADALWAEPVHERHLAAVELLQAVPRRVFADDLAWFDAHLRDCHTWALVDPLAGLVVADLAARQWDETLPVLDRWVVDDDFWMRRSAVLALRSALRRGEHLDRLFDYAERLLPDTEFFVRKVIGWVLREVAPHHPREVSAWLRAHLDEISLITLREPLRKLPDGDEIRALYDSRRNAVGVVEHDAVLVDLDLDRGAGGLGLDAPAMARPAGCNGATRPRPSSVSGSMRTTGTSAAWPSSSGSRRIGSAFGERRAREVDVVAAVELGAVGAVHLAPAPGAVGGQPQVGLLEVAEQDELAHLPRGGQAHDVLHPFAGELARTR